MPLYAQPFVFAHGLSRPESYQDRYTTLEILLSFAPSYVKDVKPLKKQNKEMLFSLIDFEDIPDDIQNRIEKSGEEFDDEKDVVVRYNGKKGAVLTWVMELSDYSSIVVTSEHSACESNGYICLGKDRLHLLVLGRKIGDNAVDDLQGCHGVCLLCLISSARWQAGQPEAGPVFGFGIGEFIAYLKEAQGLYLGASWGRVGWNQQKMDSYHFH